MFQTSCDQCSVRQLDGPLQTPGSNTELYSDLKFKLCDMDVVVAPVTTQRCSGLCVYGQSSGLVPRREAGFFKVRVLPLSGISGLSV